MNIAICDDNMEHMNIIEDELERISRVKLDCDLYQSGEDLVYAYKNKKERYDVVFLDMEMQKLNGMETANLIKEIDERAIIIFVTSHSEYMKESFKCQPFRFIEKPVDFDELKSAFDDVCKKLSKQRKVFAFSENKKKVRLYCDDIVYCESQAHWIWIHTKDETYKICKSLSDLHDQLDKEMLYRVHRSFIINFNFIKSIKETDIELYHGDKLIPISRSYKKETLEGYTNFVERNLYV